MREEFSSKHMSIRAPIGLISALTAKLLGKIPGWNPILTRDTSHLTSLASAFLTLTPNRGHRRKDDPEATRFFGNVHRGSVPVRK